MADPYCDVTLSRILDDFGTQLVSLCISDVINISASQIYIILHLWGYKNTKNYNYIYIVYTCLYHIDLHEDILIKTLLPLAQAATVAAPGRHQRRRGLRSHPLCKLICG